MTNKSKITISLGNRFTSYFPGLAYFELTLTTEAFLYPHPCLAAFCFVVQAGLELSVLSLSLLSAGFMGLSHHTWQDNVDKGDFS